MGDLLVAGDDIIALAFKCEPLNVVLGVLDVPTLKIDIVDPPLNTGNIVIASRDIATFDTGDIDVIVL